MAFTKIDQILLEMKEIVADPAKKSKLLRIDWSENVELFQTRQEKSHYYTIISASINTGVLYEHDRVISLGTISDVKSHMAAATMAYVAEMLKSSDLSDTETLYVISDNPTSQYRNRKMVFLIKVWAKTNNINVIWVYTETGHGKGPMDGVGASIKHIVKDTIAYNPNGVIANTEQLFNHLPIMPQVHISTYGDENVNKYKATFPTPLENLMLVSQGALEFQRYMRFI